MDDPPDARELDWLRWVYEQLARLESHWTAQIQNQQQRISAILTVNGVLLGFLAGAGFLSGRFLFGTFAADLFLLSLVLLCLSLLVGLAALTPVIRIAKEGDLWLDAPAVWQRTASMDPGELRELCESAVQNQTRARHARRIQVRRWMMNAQLGLLAIALIILILALLNLDNAPA
jgi:hypothetical protein